MNEIILKVAEAVKKDVGRGLARIDPADIENLHATIGDIIEIVGKKRTVAKVMPAFKEERGKGIIQIDGPTRGNAHVGLDEKVTIKKITWNSADNVVLTPITAVNLERDSRYIGSLLDGLPVIAGDRIRATLFGSRFTDFVVEATIPKGVVVINPTTLLKINEKKSGTAERVKFSYEDIGGLGHEIQRIREMIELPLKHPEIFERLGIDAPKGVLLYGPPGCGKTLIARAVANETDAHFITINGPEIIHKFYGESEARLREIFEDAKKHAPSIIFLDEIDAIAPKREHVVGDVEKRVVAQLLALMDGLDSRGHVIVIAATNIPGALDPALRRPGRFDREISIPIPDQNARLPILEIHSRGMPLSEDVDLHKLAEITHGFVGADLQALCREAAMLCLRKVIPEMDFGTSNIPYETMMNLKVSMEHFVEALKEIEPSALREVFVEIPNVRWEDVGGLETVKQQIREAVEWPLKYSDMFKRAKINTPKGILLYGPPGTGKTLIAKAVASETKINFISVKGPALISKYVGESERGIRDIFKKAKQAAPCIIFFDELDVIVPRRGEGGDSHVTERVIGQFLTEMDGIEELKGVLVLAATNRMDQIDPALLRAGRFDYLIEIPIPDEETRLKIFQIHTKDKPLEKGLDLRKFTKETDGMTGADIELVCKRAALMTIRNAINKQGAEIGEFVITANDFTHSIEEVKQR
ncbi:MAG: AAA family ATPase [Candidatus Brocadia sp. AMX2]|uniref:Transitional endoplasmic reticulum ATPase n=1 Tax=Candidatus Brocadia sinica JPN1 TaxID=1197129 RepID=A0ABQ0JTX1_9BACT|nr:MULTISPECIES: CDC48 family AAA ATPase [Brocadia]KXK32324.1 MAG: cell division protein ATPase [Candidatus Brocadia sinica]MBC6933051.1 AAA family ATPase [Candidatus Brocadia sp.]MBL1169064.1 AAA family ATPase [Candidatus Brocadia sp. AMX1]NOG41949.1 CDC48 family AAA ATPase [Planctomycetota bacterium]KAA0243832.1 MAG: AAA family ATPase [Candidatus Brocadia sp. AMX2]